MLPTLRNLCILLGAACPARGHLKCKDPVRELIPEGSSEITYRFKGCPGSLSLNAPRPAGSRLGHRDRTNCSIFLSTALVHPAGSHPECRDRAQLHHRPKCARASH
eukprot:1161241-Pelagomonas_calceolata.AAC.9